MKKHIRILLFSLLIILISSINQKTYALKMQGFIQKKKTIKEIENPANYHRAVPLSAKVQIKDFYAKDPFYPAHIQILTTGINNNQRQPICKQEIIDNSSNFRYFPTHKFLYFVYFPENRLALVYNSTGDLSGLYFSDKQGFNTTFHLYIYPSGEFAHNTYFKSITVWNIQKGYDGSDSYTNGDGFVYNPNNKKPWSTWKCY